MKLSAVVLICAVCVALAAGVPVRSLLFPTQTNTSHILVTPQKHMNMSAFTLCLRVATEEKVGRDRILFSYRTQEFDALNVWSEKDGRLSLYLNDDTVLFEMPHLGPLQTHLCVTWDSSSGATSYFLDGKRSLTKVFKKGHHIPSGGRVIIGQDFDKATGKFDANQSFVGEISDINLWSMVLPDDEIRDMVTGRPARTPYIIDWDTVNLEVKGEAMIINGEV